VLIVGVIRLRQGAASVEEIFMVSFLFAMLAVPVRSIGWTLTELPRSVAGWDRGRSVLGATGDFPCGLRRPPAPAGTPASLSLHGARFAYDGGEGEAVAGVSFDVPAGTTVALVGPTGSGKSTIASLAARLIDPTAGSVALDGVDLRALSAAELAR